MPIEQVTCAGSSIKDAHTHYELHAHIGPELVTVEIPGYVADAFREKYRMEITEAKRLVLSGEFARNDELVAECQNPYRTKNHRKATITSLDEVSIHD